MVKFLEARRKDINKVIDIKFTVEESGVAHYVVQDNEGNSYTIKSKGSGTNEYEFQFVGPQDRDYFVITVGKFDNGLMGMTPLFCDLRIVYRNMTMEPLDYKQIKDLTIKQIVYDNQEISYLYDV